VKRKWRVVVDQLATLKADHNFNCQWQLRFGCLINGSPDCATDPKAIRRRVAHELYNKLAFTSFVIWTLGTLILFILFAAPAPNPIPAAGVSMVVPLVPAALVWALYRPLIRLQVARRLRTSSAGLGTSNPWSW